MKNYNVLFGARLWRRIFSCVVSVQPLPPPSGRAAFVRDGVVVCFASLFIVIGC
jgi:hypothetical protein